eukprot:2812538-Lingulodinium_polyedra.AAC.1
MPLAAMRTPGALLTRVVAAWARPCALRSVLGQTDRTMDARRPGGISAEVQGPMRWSQTSRCQAPG